MPRAMNATAARTVSDQPNRPATAHWAVPVVAGEQRDQPAGRAHQRQRADTAGRAGIDVHDYTLATTEPRYHIGRRQLHSHLRVRSLAIQRLAGRCHHRSSGYQERYA